MNVKLWCKQHSPELLLASGIINSLASIVLACVATSKVGPKVIEPAKQKIVETHKAMDETIVKDEKEHLRKELNKTYLKTGLKVAAYYAPTALAFGLSVASMVGSHNIMKGRNLALASAFATLKSSYDLYRDKVKAKIGEEAERALFEERKEEVVTKVNKKGKEVTETVSKPNLENDCLFGAWWGPGNTECELDSNQLNMTTLLQHERYLTQKLRAQGYLFLWDVYKELGYTPAMLGARKLQASRVLGWIYDPNDKSRASYVDFGIHDEHGSLTQKAKDFQCGAEEFIWLEFNVDGDDILTGDNGQKTFMQYAIKKSV